jgi:hypothetical protein
MVVKSHQTHIFATGADLEPGLRLIESQRRLKYVALFRYSTNTRGESIVVPHTSPDFQEYDSLLVVPSLGANRTSDHNTGDQYLVTNADAEILFESVPQRKGGIHYLVATRNLIPILVFQPGGRYQDQYLICGHIGTTSEHPESLALYKDFTKAVTRGFQKIGSYKVGPEAKRLMDEGIRMVTISIKSPPEYDLRIS